MKTTTKALLFAATLLVGCRENAVTALQAAQQSVAKLSGLSLFDYLR